MSLSAWDIAKIAINPVGWIVAEGAEKAAQMVSKASDKGIDQLKIEIDKQNLQMQFAQQQARIAQELAISRRIENAEEVEIEEFYDTSGKGNAGASFDSSSQTAFAGIAAEGRRVTKRVYHFKGWRPQEEEIISQSLEGGISGNEI